MSKDISGLELLATGIITAEARDYRKAMRSLKINPNNRAALAQKKRCEDFFLGDWITHLTTVSGEYILKRLEKEFEDE